MKLNLVNKIYLGIAVLLVFAAGYRFLNYKSWARYNYSASIFAPATFPVYVKDAYFILPGGDMESLEHESVNNFSSSWNSDYSSADPAKAQLLPVQLVLQYVSYRGHSFYRDTLDLPLQTIKGIFKTAASAKKELVLSSYAGKIKGLRFVVGIANGGNIVLRLRGLYLDEMILKKQLKPKAPLKHDTFYAEPLSVEAYRKTVFSGLSDSLKTRFNNGLDAGASYIDTPSRYIEENRELWIYQKKNGFID